MRKFWKNSWRSSLSKLLLGVLCFALCATWAFAAGSVGSISVFLTDDSDLPVGGVGVTLHRVAEPDGTLTARFVGAGVDPAAMASGLDNAKNARTLADYAAAQGISGTVRTTGSDGWARYDDLTEGIYLVLCSAGQSVTFAPYLVYLPTVINGTADYDVESFPKAEDVPPVIPTPTPGPEPTGSPEPGTYRVSYSYYGDVPAGAPLCPEEEWYAAGATVSVHPAPVLEGYSFKWTYDPTELPAANLAGLAAQQMRSSVGMARLSGSLLAMNIDDRETLSAGSFTMPANDVHIIGVFGKTGEPGATDSPEPTDSPKPDQPDLPQTGVKVWPVYLLLGLGSLFVVAGLIDLCVTRRKRDE